MSTRSTGRRFGARRRGRRKIRSCCFNRIFSARTARVPPGPRTTVSLASRCTSNTIAFPIGQKLEQHWTTGQESWIAAAEPRNYEFAMYRQHTLRHGRSMNQLPEQTAPPAKTLVTEMDGTMIPVMQPGSGPDARKGKQLLWREARLCLARPTDKARALYGSTLGTAE